MTDITTQPGELQPGQPQPGPLQPGPTFDPMIAPGRGAASHGAQPMPADFGPMSPEFNDPYYDPEEWERLPRRTSFAFRLGVITMIVLLAGTFLYSKADAWLSAQIDPPGLQGDRLLVEIPSGATASDVMRILADVDVISNSTVAQYWIRRNDVGEFQAGDYEFRLNSSFDEAVAVLQAGPLPPVFKRLALAEGLWSGDMRNVMLDNLVTLDPTELDNAINNGQVRSQFQPASVDTLEGLMFPATYQISEEESADELAMVQRLVNTMDNVIVELGVDDGLVLENGRQLTPYELIIVASMIEEEARLDVDRAKIARVIYNRLIAGEALGIDATTIYGVHLAGCEQRPACSNPSTSASWYDPELFQSQLDDLADPYNTRVVVGLPPTPISSPGRASLNAALNPEPGDWRWYVLMDTDGRHFFTNDFGEFERQVAESRANGVF